jgi:hypothetical protein
MTVTLQATPDPSSVSVAVLLEASQGATHSAGTRVVLADAGVENVNAHVDALIETGVLRRLLACTEMTFSNSMIEAWWRSLKHQWLFLHALDSVATVRRLVAFYVHEHNHVLPHSTFRGRRRTRCTSARATRWRRTWHHALPLHAGPAWRPTDRSRPTRRARH